MSSSVNFCGTENKVATPVAESKKESELQKDVEFEEKSSKKGKTALLCASLAALAATGAYMVLRKKPVAPQNKPFDFMKSYGLELVDGKLISKATGELFEGWVTEGHFKKHYRKGVLDQVYNSKTKITRWLGYNKGDKLIVKIDHKNNIETSVRLRRRENGTLEYCQIQRRDTSNRDTWGFFENNHLGDGYRACYDEFGKLIAAKEKISYAADKANNNYGNLGVLCHGD